MLLKVGACANRCHALILFKPASAVCFRGSCGKLPQLHFINQFGHHVRSIRFHLDCCNQSGGAGHMLQFAQPENLTFATAFFMGFVFSNPER
jgi:hypothetical protein